MSETKIRLSLEETRKKDGPRASSNVVLDLIFLGILSVNVFLIRQFLHFEKANTVSMFIFNPQPHHPNLSLFAKILIKIETR
jgi:hypothetical protein